MASAVDSNVVIALLEGDAGTSAVAQSLLDRAFAEGPMIVSAPVYAELLAGPDRRTRLLDRFLADTGLRIDFELRESVWRAAGSAFGAYTRRRRASGGGAPRRILADFLIGAHASDGRHQLVTLDGRLYRAAFPTLRLLTVGA